MRQYGLKESVSPETALQQFVLWIERNMAKKTFALVSFQTSWKLFAHINFNSLAASLLLVSCWVFSEVSDSGGTKIGEGCPQGGISSSFLWNPIMNSKLRKSALILNPADRLVPYFYCCQNITIIPYHELCCDYHTLLTAFRQISKYCLVMISFVVPSALCWISGSFPPSSDLAHGYNCRAHALAQTRLLSCDTWASCTAEYTAFKDLIAVAFAVFSLFTPQFNNSGAVVGSHCVLGK